MFSFEKFIRKFAMPGLVPPARPKPLRRGEGPGVQVIGATSKVVDGRDKPGHDDPEASHSISAGATG
ncbi:hypothetical protein C7U92_11155 [Bradyrhizobium sp. WBOS7]|uniref:Uncharacterized protein n=1 Tax=Bradyrhizobium betae TaxID=244734 RepID=A0AAE9N4K0_9BRAD|nr:hypothetical protein [Bradyrhizobium sp. WBOS2]MDD1572527.1 hypothetical protein [Bradyrhizobium sp. WBOS1]MDD1577284.1 hypothetical protein [Bradyrhizobium sp. WBOS7]MDD1600331.1 hypothetical protein [Bradyrhizobium sp. WBOS16]UUO34087.1 hypothetical protein DCK84_05535 [Bradyrhizobium sp. WBOS01]UUO40379.1 hypothetical protein DCM75_06170 [Bradyrhizobium sp. WBOS02]UUO52545.1 hypothetical protein DCM79_05810 [Bradyrhizobium sp. WBOS07]UUO64672.1 hypothetical protein DCM83_05185 [Bradyrh